MSCFMHWKAPAYTTRNGGEGQGVFWVPPLHLQYLLMTLMLINLPARAGLPSEQC